MCRGRWTGLAVAVAVVAVVAIVVGRPGRSAHNPRPHAPTSTRQTGTLGVTRTHTHCITRPSICGYPDPSTTGVPAGTKLTPSATVTVTRPGTVIRGLDVIGSIEIEANNVTVLDTRVTNASPSGHAIRIAPYVHGTSLLNSTLRGENTGQGSLAIGIQNDGTADTRALRVYAYNLDTAFHGPGIVRGSYFLDNATIAGEHYEPIFYAGGAGPLIVDHNTLLNPHPQTACVFAWTNQGPEIGLRITDNLMAGGGYMIYAGGDHPRTRDVTISGNRFSTIYWRHGGYYGVAAYVRAAATTSAGNFWDASLGRATT